MTDEQILKKAIEKAIKNGWTYVNGADFAVDKVIRGWDITIFNDDGMVTVDLFTIIFSHDFAKAFWGTGTLGWRIGLETMVLEKDPIKYLEQFLK